MQPEQTFFFWFDAIAVHGSSLSSVALFTAQTHKHISFYFWHVARERMVQPFWKHNCGFAHFFATHSFLFDFLLFFNKINSDLFAFLTSRKPSFRQHYREQHKRYFERKRKEPNKSRRSKDIGTLKLLSFNINLLKDFVCICLCMAVYLLLLYSFLSEIFVL